MIDDIFQKRPKRHIKDLNIVPILDMLTTVIFFLLLSTSFVQYTKLTLPASQVSTVNSQVSTPPPSPKLVLVDYTAGQKRLTLFWGGLKPGEATEIISQGDSTQRRSEIMKRSLKLVEAFVKLYPTEKTIQVGLGSHLPYQDLISVMDGVRDKMQDVVLISYNEAEARAQATTPAPAQAGG